MIEFKCICIYFGTGVLIRAPDIFSHDDNVVQRIRLLLKGVFFRNLWFAQTEISLASISVNGRRDSLEGKNARNL